MMIQVACVKIDANTKEVDSYKLLTLKQFLQVFRGIQTQAAAIKVRRVIQLSVMMMRCNRVFLRLLMMMKTVPRPLTVLTPLATPAVRWRGPAEQRNIPFN